MASLKSLFLPLTLLLLSPSSHSYNTLQVGGKDGWTLHPSEPYSNWAGRLRFQINDTLHFKYDGGKDSVLVVNRGDYDGCNVDGGSLIGKLEGGDSVFRFNRSGPFYFITGNKSNCDQGQKMIVVVLAVRYPPPPPSAASPPVISPVFPPSPAVSVSPVSPPSPSPVISPVSAPSPGISPVLPPSPVISPVLPPSPEISPVLPPTPVISPVSTPPSETPVLTPPANSPGGGSTPRGGGTAGNNPAADTTSPPAATAARTSLSGGVIGLVVTVIFVLWGF